MAGSEKFSHVMTPAMQQAAVKGSMGLGIAEEVHLEGSTTDARTHGILV